MLARIVTEALWRTGALALTRPLRSDRLLVLRYHSVCADDTAPEYVSSSIAVPVRAFDGQMRYLSRHFQCISIDEAISSLREKRAFERPSVVVTFDDGYRDNYEYALPILAQYRIPATIYLVSGVVGQGRVLWTSRLRYVLSRTPHRQLRSRVMPRPLALESDSARAVAARVLTNILNQLPAIEREAALEDIAWTLDVPHVPPAAEWFLSGRQASEMRTYGITFGAHTVTHPNLPGVPTAEAAAEVQQSRRDLERLLGTEVRHFSYPNSGALHPHFNDGVVQQVIQAGYRSAVTSQPGPCHRATDVFRIPRLGINRSKSALSRFGMFLEMNRLQFGIANGSHD